MTSATPMNPKKMKVSELRAALESRGLSSNGLKTELIQRLELALDEEEFGSEAQEMEALKVPSPKKTKKAEPKKKEALVAEPEAPKKTKLKTPSPVKKTAPPATESVPADKETKKEETKEAGAGSEPKLVETERGSETISVLEMDASTKSETEEEKRATRAAKFGIPMSLDDKKAQRAKRFHLPSAVVEEESAKRLKRAERFHLETTNAFEKKKDARAERFGLNAEEKRRLDRAKRFGLETSEVFEEKRRKRMERFTAATK
ncbi:SAP domain-containing protein [Phytophthora infestans]|uniref:SAP domain-containing protein n=1 Tax=Phytophthora infestans TaxID=4787 RepID=A0A833W712_PHYIN|nr:SAP domain-containing protein [Phytophthora infestans]KAF4148110.1 SAP domain-containing protein [Phytophthora infestans]